MKREVGRSARLAGLPMLLLVLVLLLGASLAHAAGPPADGRRSGFDFMGPALQALQRDDTQNPGLLWVKEGASLWSRNAGSRDASCASCHGDAAISMRGVAARYPALDARTALPINLSQRINLCRQNHQQALPLPGESQEMLSLESYVAHQSRGLPVASPGDPRLAPFVRRGQRLFAQRIGQLNLSCAQCHDQFAGQRLGGSVIPQAHATGYPVYRLEWQGIGSLKRRLRSCMAGVRAEPFAPEAQEWIELELYLVQRAQGMAVETPAVRP